METAPGQIVMSHLAGTVAIGQEVPAAWEGLYLSLLASNFRSIVARCIFGQRPSFKLAVQPPPMAPARLQLGHLAWASA